MTSEDVQLALEAAREFPEASTSEIAEAINSANAATDYLTLKRPHVRRQLEAIHG